MSTKSVTVRLPDGLYDYISERSEKENRTMSNMIIHMLTNEMQRQGRFYFQSKKGAITIEDVSKRCTEMLMEDLQQNGIEIR